MTRSDIAGKSILPHRTGMPNELDIDEWLQRWYAFAAAVRAQLEPKLGFKIGVEEFQEAIEQLHDIRPGGNFLVHMSIPDVAETVARLDGYQWPRPDADVTLQTIQLGSSILPDDTVLLATEQWISAASEQWQINQNDPDPFPSNPHAHLLGSDLKLHLGNGWLYRKHTPVQQVKRKHLMQIRNKCHHPLPPLEI